MILVGVDGSAYSRQALRWALAEARSWRVPLTVVHVWPGVSDLVAETGEAKRREAAARDVLDATVDTALLGEEPGTRVHKALRAGVPAHVLIDESAEADLVVVGRRGLGGFAGLVIGSTSQQCVTHAHCPVAVVPPDPPQGQEPGRVVVGVDNSEQGLAALRWAMTEAARRQVPLVAVHAYSPPYFVGPVGVEPGVLDVDVRPQAEAVLEDALGKAAADFGTSVRIERVVEEGPAAQTLMRLAGPHDVLVVGSRGRGGFAGLLLGSTSQQCAEHARGPVVVVRAKH